jgi:hypothetical protein
MAPVGKALNGGIIIILTNGSKLLKKLKSETVLT